MIDIGSQSRFYKPTTYFSQGGEVARLRNDIYISTDDFVKSISNFFCFWAPFLRYLQSDLKRCVWVKSTIPAQGIVSTNLQLIFERDG